MLGERIGKYPNDAIDFLARRVRDDIPQRSQSYIEQVDAQILYTDKGTFWAPNVAIALQAPWDYDPIECSMLKLVVAVTEPVCFEKQFNVLNIIGVDFENQTLCRPLDFDAPVRVAYDEVKQFRYAYAATPNFPRRLPRSARSRIYSSADLRRSA